MEKKGCVKMHTSAKKSGFFGYGMCNPVIKKMAKKSEAQEFIGEESPATYNGILGKTLYFLLFCLVGLGIFFPLHNMFMANAKVAGSVTVIENIKNLEGIVRLETCGAEAKIFLLAGAVAILFPLIAWLVRPAIPVVGTLYALCEGYFIGVVTEALVPEYRWISFAALVITVILVATMLFLYKREYVKVTKKFRMIISALFITSILSGLLIFLLNFVPFLHPIISSMTSFMGSPVVSIALSVIYIIIAAMFLLVDFDVIKRCVEENCPKKYEWMAAFGLTYTVIYIYFKILNLIIQITSTNKNKNN